jgi:hypothetical protein
MFGLRKMFANLIKASEPQLLYDTSAHQAEVDDRLARVGIRVERGRPGIPMWRPDMFDHALRMSQRRPSRVDLPTNNAALGHVTGAPR